MPRLRVVNQIARVSCFVLPAAFVAAQTPDERAAIAKKSPSRRRRTPLRSRHSWQMRVAVTAKGDAKPPKLYAMRFDMDGKIEKTELTAEAPPEGRERGLKGRVKEKKLDGDPVDGQVQFASLSGGPNYAAKTTLNVPAKQVSALIENFNYSQQ
jgi:hypothetical protein